RCATTGAGMSRVGPARPARRGRRTPKASLLPGVVGAAAFLVLACGALIAFELRNWDQITPAVVALGTPLAAMPISSPSARLGPGIQQLMDRPLQIRGADQSWATTARDLGLRLDADEMTHAAYMVGRQGSPFDRLGDQIDSLVRGRTISPTSATDQTALDQSLAAMAKQIERPPRDASLGLAADGSLQATPAVDGLTVDIGASRDQVAGVLVSGEQTADLVTRAVPPAIPDTQVQTARDQLDRLVGQDAQPLTVTFADGSWQLTRADLAKVVSLDVPKQSGQ